jgi:hypothetical protein
LEGNENDLQKRMTYLRFSFGKEFLEGNEMAFKKG